MVSGKYIRTKEIKEKNRIANIGKIPWNKGLKGSIKSWNKGLTKETDERIKRYGEKQKGKVVSEKTKQKMRDNIPDRSGENNPFFGKHHTEDSRKKISDNHADMSRENSPLFGKCFSEEHKQKLKENHADFSGRNNPQYGKMIPINQYKRSYYESPLQDKVCFRSNYELAYAKYLDEHQILWMYEMETFDLGDTTYTPDFFLPQFEKFIEIKGFMRKESQEKINKFLEQYPWDLEILYKEDLIRIGCEL